MTIQLDTTEWPIILHALDEAKDAMIHMQRKCIIYEDKTMQTEYNKMEQKFVALKANILKQIEEQV
jgi:hypothetical protein